MPTHNRRYILDEHHNPQPCPSLLKWAAWVEDDSNRHVDDTRLPNGYRVSTIFLGLDHNFAGGTPILFETMTFPATDDQIHERYSTWDEAKAGHAEACLRAAEWTAVEGAAAN